MNYREISYDGDLKPLKRIFFVVTALFLVLATTFAFLDWNRRQLEKRQNEFSRLEQGLARVREASLNRKHALETLRSLIALETRITSPERLIYGKVEEINTRLKPDDMTIKTVGRAGGNASLEYTLKFRNPDYNGLLNAVSQLQQAIFPFVSVSVIDMSRSELNGKMVTEFTVEGTIVTPEKVTP